jgi:WD40 repeat protein
MATATATRFHPPKVTLFPTYIRKQKTTSFPDIPPRGEKPIDNAKLRTLAWSPLGTQIVTAHMSKPIKIWDAEKSRAPIAEFVLRGEKADKVLFHPLGEPEIASIGADGMVRFFDVRSKTATGEVKVGAEAFTLAWSPDGNELVVGKKVDDEVPFLSSNAFHQEVMLTMYVSIRTTISCALIALHEPFSPQHACATKQTKQPSIG